MKKVTQRLALPLFRLAGADGEVTMRMIVVVVLLFFVWKMFPDTVLGFFEFVSDTFFGSLEDAEKSGKVEGPLDRGAKSPPGDGTGVQTEKQDSQSSK